MVNESYKRTAFEYLLDKLLIWYHEVEPYRGDESFTRVKVLKLLFFLSVIKHEDNSDLLDVFDNFYAMQHGPVESDIYNYMTSGKLENFSFSEIYLTRKREYSSNEMELPNALMCKLDRAIAALRVANPKIISLAAFDLVEISHKWESWKHAMKLANLLGKYSYPISISQLRGEMQIFR